MTPMLFLETEGIAGATQLRAAGHDSAHAQHDGGRGGDDDAHVQEACVTLGSPTGHSCDIGGGLDGQTVIQVAALEGIGVALHGADSPGLCAVHQAEGQEHREC